MPHLLTYGGDGLTAYRRTEDNGEALELVETISGGTIGLIRWHTSPDNPLHTILTQFTIDEPWQARGYGRWNGGALLDELEAQGQTRIIGVGMTNEQPIVSRGADDTPNGVELDLTDQSNPFRQWVRATSTPTRPPLQ
jgi:hypothetical protein